MKRVAPAWWVLIVWMLGGWCRIGHGGESQDFQGMTMGTTWRIQVLPPEERPSVELEALPGRVRAWLAAWSLRVSHYDSRSELARVNEMAASGWRVISPELLDLLSQAEALRRSSGGLFDARLGRVVAERGFGPRRLGGLDCGLPLPERALGLREDPPAVTFRVPCVGLDLSGWAKGLAVDRLSMELTRWGWGRHLVEIGGEVRVCGSGPDRDCWRVAVRHPDPRSSSPAEMLELVDQSVAVSGTLLQRRSDEQGRSVSHIFDPRTGESVVSDWVGVRVIHPECGVADAWATAFLVGGPDSVVPDPPRGSRVRWLHRNGGVVDRSY